MTCSLSFTMRYGHASGKFDAYVRLTQAVSYYREEYVDPIRIYRIDAQTYSPLINTEGR